MPQKLKIGYFCIGLDTYWPQFEGLLPRLIGYKDQIKEKLVITMWKYAMPEWSIIPLRRKNAAALFKRSEIDVIFLFISTYALSHNVLPVVQACKVPVIVLNLQPVPAIDYKKLNRMTDRGVMTGEWLAHCQACVLPELSSVFNRSDIAYHLLTGYLEDGQVWQELSDWIDALKVKKHMAQNRLGIVGHYYNGMLDVYTDLTLQTATFGNHIEIIEFGVIKKFREESKDSEVKAKIGEFNTIFDVSAECEESRIMAGG